MPFFGLGIDLITPIKNRPVFAPMALCRRNKPNLAVAMRVVVPRYEVAHPFTRGQQRGKALRGPLRTIFQGPEQRLRIRVIIADPGPAMRRRNAQIVKLGLQRLRLHRTAIVGMQHQRLAPAMLGQDRALYQSGRRFTTLLLVYFPTNDFAAEDVHDQVQIKEPAAHAAR